MGSRGAELAGAADPRGFERVLRAFSLRRNLRLLFVPPEGHLRPLDGLRALSIIWVVVFHTGWYVGMHIPLHMYAGLLVSKWMLPVWRGDFGVDVFFVLSGFLIAGMLLDERERTGRLRLGLFYARRMLRLWPALVAAVILYVWLIDHQSSMVWANLLYVSNFIPILQAAMGWTWSLAIEEQFYLVCPWLVLGLARLGGRARFTGLFAIAVALACIGAWVVASGGFYAHDSEIVVDRPFLWWAHAYDHLYDKPWMRAGPLLAGVAAAYVYRLPGAMDVLAKKRVAPVIGLVLALAAAVVCMEWPLVVGARRALEVTYLAGYRTIFGAAVAYLVLLSVSRHPLGATFGRVLSSRLLFPFSQLAYSAYLLNPIVTTLIDRALAPLVWQGKAEPMPLFLPTNFAGTFLAAAAINLLIERPFMELRPRAEPPVVEAS